MRSRVYIDGFNLYFGCLKGSAYRWLDPRLLGQCLFPGDEIGHVRYFTARVKTGLGKGGRSQRQEVYLRALSTLDGLSIHEGRYELREKTGKLRSGKLAKVTVPEEKGSDVNLASWLLLDGFRGLYERAIVVSNDSDLAEPIQMVHRELGLKVAIAPPLLNNRRMSGELRQATRLIREIRVGALRRSLLPNELFDGAGRRITKPKQW